MQPYFNPTRWNVEDDLHFFENGRRPHFFQMEDDLNFVLGNLGSLFLVCNIVSRRGGRGDQAQKNLKINFKKLDEIWKMTSIFWKIEDHLNFFQM